ncbi:TonB-dependent receptor [Lacibacter sp. H375]|uniref:SusC/RagA family TonB-linked outer membrane protein n=1 Tax=Lacibacter sp. H375 TaxID=3133424 RepID=UPI0030C23096
MRKLVSMTFVLLLCMMQAVAQEKTVTGKVTDEKDGTPLSGVSVTVKGSSIGTTTAVDGTFRLSIPSSARTLVFSFVNYAAVEMNVANRSTFTVSLSSTDKDLQEVVVVAYGTKKKSDLTGSVATVKAADIENKPFSSVDKILQGGVPGLQSVAASGQPGAAQNILIRGASSITASTAPLWVIDGIPINSGDASRLQTTANLLSTLNPNDIETITVLKDAASQSIYGSRAANGVILVTTKKGKAGKTVFRFDTEFGVNSVAYENDRYRPLTSAEYFTITTEGLVNAGASQATINSTLAGLGFGNGNDFNWKKGITNENAAQQQYNLSVQGGNERTTFFLSGGHFIQEGTTVNSKFKRTTGNFKLTHKATDKLTIIANLNGGFVNQRAPLAGGAFGNPVLSSFFLLPSRSAYNTDGTWNYNLGGLHNTIALTELDKRFLREISMRGGLSAEYKILKNLRFKTSYGGDLNFLEEDQYNNPFHGDGLASNGRAFSYYTRYYNWVWTNTLDLDQKITRNGDLSLNAQIGYESQKSNGYFSSLQSQDYPPTLLLTYPAAGARPTTASATISDYSFNSQFGSVALNYQDRFVVSGSLRRDGSSRFGAKNKFGVFYSIGGTWNVDKEAFMQNVEFVNQLKLRASYGVNGNAGIGNYDWLPLYGYGANYNQQPGSFPSNVGDSSLTWELNKPFNVGIDFSILKNRVSVSVDYYTRKSEDLLLNVPLSRTTGFSSATRNIGEMENKGVEVDIKTIPVLTKDFTWNLDLNFAHNQNRITSLPGGQDIADGNFIIRQGVAYRTFFLREYAGVDPANGDPLWYTDATRKTTTNVYPGAGARILQGNALPKFFGGLTNTFTYKNFSLDVQLYYNFGNFVYDTWGSYYVGAGFGATFNKVSRVLNRWQKPGDVTDIPKYIYNGNKNFQGGSSFYLNSGDFVRVRNLQLAYTLPKTVVSKIKLTGAQFYFRGTNLFTWVKDKNLPFDPEQGTGSATNLQVFIPKTITAGLNITF